jgi:hypothetical protein
LAQVLCCGSLHGMFAQALAIRSVSYRKTFGQFVYANQLQCRFLAKSGF